MKIFHEESREPITPTDYMPYSTGVYGLKIIFPRLWDTIDNWMVDVYVFVLYELIYLGENYLLRPVCG